MKTASGACDAFEESSNNLDLGHVDLYLIHAPWPWSDMGSDHRDGNVEVWKVFEELYDAGRTKSIGVSNFAVADLEDLLGRTDVVPHANQIRWFIGNTQDETTAFDREHDILTEGYSPLATGGLLENEQIAEIAAKYDKTVAQVAIRYLLEKDVLPLPKSTTPSRIAENADVDFVLAAEDVAAPRRARGHRELTRPHPRTGGAVPAGTAPPVGTRPSHGRGSAAVRTHGDLGYEVPVLALEVVVGGRSRTSGQCRWREGCRRGSLAFVIRGGV
ncbi:aldo/keto reductase [Curtobacterium flaccumfaciens]|nr:aldo/keto reductase [Curtobacterium flaccumfaciens]